MNKKKLRKYNRNIHRDLGYFFAALTLMYSLSGIALNHIHHWDPNYRISVGQVQVDIPQPGTSLNKEQVLDILGQIGREGAYKKHYYPKGQLKVFLKDGSLALDPKTGQGTLEEVRVRPVLSRVNFLHYNRIKKLYTWVADIFGLALILLAISGLFILRGKQGITGRGAWLSLAGLLLPLVFIFVYY